MKYIIHYDHNSWDKDFIRSKEGIKSIEVFEVSSEKELKETLKDIYRRRFLEIAPMPAEILVKHEESGVNEYKCEIWYKYKTIKIDCSFGKVEFVAYALNEN